jgi:hypothetical protein
VLGEGIGSSKKAAQLSAAAMALVALQQRSGEDEAPPADVTNPPAGAPAADGRVIAFRARRKPRPKPKAPN